MNALKAILYYFSIVIAIIFLGLPYAYFHCYRKRDWSDYTRICCYFFPWLFPKFGIDVEVEGKENIPDKRCINIGVNKDSGMNDIAKSRGTLDGDKRSGGFLGQLLNRLAYVLNNL